MSLTFKKSLGTVLFVALFALPRPVNAGSIGDFFKSLGNSIAHPGQAKKTKPAPTPASKKSKTKSGDQPPAPDSPPSPPPIAAAPQTPTPTATSTQPAVRPASAPPVKDLKRDMPYGIPIPNRPGFVTSPYSPKSGYVDVRGFPSGTEVGRPAAPENFPHAVARFLSLATPLCRRVFWRTATERRDYSANGNLSRRP